MASGAGLMIDAINTVTRNRTLARNRRAKYAILKQQYIGIANESSEAPHVHLTPTQVAEGHMRAIAYYKKRNFRIYTQIVLMTFLVLVLVGSLIHKFLLN